MIFWTLLAMFCALLAFSLTLQAWFLILAFLVFRVTRQSKGVLVRRLGLMSLVIFAGVFGFDILPTIQE